jgi:hypothetical protein
MSTNKILWMVIRIVLVVSVLCLVMLFFSAPGFRDGATKIKNKYSFQDSGWHEKTIIYDNGSKFHDTIIDARVVQYVVDGEKIFVARNPVEVFYENGITNTKLTGKCEYWVIDTVTHSIAQIESSNKVSCK